MFKRICLLLCIASLLVVGLPGDAETLKGGVAFHRVGPLLLEGSAFTPDSLPQQQTLKTWYQIPDWIAGTWQREVETSFLPLPLLGHYRLQSRLTRSWGQQVDRRGHIWQANETAAVNTVEGLGATTYMIATINEPLSISTDAVTMRCVSTNIKVDNETSRIVKTFQQESIQTFKPSKHNILVCREKIRVFDQDGKPIQLGLTPDKFEDKRIAPFVPITINDRHNYYLEFCQYLTSIGHPELIPPEPLECPGPSASPPANLP